ncbi:MAG: bifunctional DNA-formamidopyrimidine glycosylase/DNA-(apurinic or apyrimidinic site) lyase [Pelolinea sp.]|nr:bifunctional DNA-formamidopyrimidine glycosylase/DNA-(apurinic or apyrimidinic site) lyase [Pelolinea sp.]
MPELPEVETIVRSLINPPDKADFSIIGRRIKNVLVFWERTLANLPPGEFISRVKRQSVQAVGRRGKFLVLTLSKDTMLIHLRMSGDLRMEKNIGLSGAEIPPQKHDRLILVFDEDVRLAFSNPRKFGRVWLVADPEEILRNLGPEPLEEGLDAGCFHDMLGRHKRQLKPLIMDQHFLAGMGNIYTDEALFLAKLHPLKRSHMLTEAESDALLNAIRTVLREGIRRNGASIDWVFRGGDFQNQFKVYGRAGDACLVCGTDIQRLIVGQRGTHICPNCQHM